MNAVTFDQIRGPVERIVLVVLGYLVAKGYITSADVAGYAMLILGIVAALYGWWQNRPKAIVQSAAALGNTTVITTPELAKDTAETNIISNTSTPSAIAKSVEEQKSKEAK